MNRDDAARLIDALIEGDRLARMCGRDAVLTDEVVDALEEALVALCPPPPPVENGDRMVEFVVYGKPVPQGSKVQRTTKDGRSYMHEDNAAELRRWRRAIRDEAKARRVGWVRQAPLVVELTFMFRGTTTTPVGFKATAPDIDKLCRAVLDGCTDGGMWTDDAQVVKLLAQKRYGATPGVRVRVRDAR